MLLLKGKIERQCRWNIYRGHLLRNNSSYEPFTKYNIHTISDETHLEYLIALHFFTGNWEIF